MVTKIVPDYCSRADASRELARRLTKWWHDQGYTGVRFWVEKDAVNFRKPLYVVRSNLVLLV